MRHYNVSQAEFDQIQKDAELASDEVSLKIPSLMMILIVIRADCVL